MATSSKKGNSLILATQGYIGGISAGLAQLFVGQPFDTVKVRMTANSSHTMKTAI